MSNVRRLPTPCTEEWDWQLRGLCRGMNSALFFHPDNARGNDRKLREERAKAICHACPVLAQCRQHALQVEEPYGVWGGLGEQERRELITRQRRQLRMPRTA
ncbi:WhiB family transcriptional regulator [Goodfellowiella coeruleoviolacea]|uniref:Transcriptional regulator WhiB n=1 Tax=Goodfellowiella coeruleoviolacea TaxID=334858 RepID=A0AAE3GFR9_9PSEU|nr:WhiB family transcriptional regulator [Goodfellowiella coeruleoviolacea]MCP2166514.1 WhiB family transcriptional regulator, redox-sensing transcriptional regulator [Goodfellowiella coeruleoviolacea]